MPLLLTPGDPAGIGPDITLDILSRKYQDNILVVADAHLLEERAAALQIETELNVFSDFQDSLDNLSPDAINILHTDICQPCKAGVLDSANSRYVLDCLDIAERLCREGKADGMVTGPVHKGIINDAGFQFTGHTEYLAEPSNSQPVMMLATEDLRVVLATTHLPLKDIAGAITRQSLTDVLTITDDFLKQRFKIDRPHILVCGLNPHAGEDGHLGSEEIDTISPVIEQCIEQGMNLTGPLPADTAFTRHHLPTADAVLAMYHDQGLPVLKYSGFGKAVNVTMGLPFVRTSVDHGTALELAATGKADSSSLDTAIAIAMKIS